MKNAVRALIRRGCLLAGTILGGALPGCITPGGIDGPDPPGYQPRYRPVPPPKEPPATHTKFTTDGTPGSVVQASALLPVPKSTAPKLDIPRALPGAEATLPVLPPDTPATRAERLKVIESLFPPLSDLGPDPLVDGLPGTQPATLEEMLDIGKRNSPVIAQAAADVEEARGRWLQAGLYPNPTAGFQGDAMGNLGTAGQVGGFFTQNIVTAGKLKLSRAVASYDYLNAKLRLRKAEIDLARQVRADYYATLVAAETVRFTRFISEFTGRVYEHQVGLVRGGTAAPFEAAALRAVVNQSRVNLVQVRNRYTAAWRKLAATLNAPEMTPVPLAGRVEESLPRFDYDSLHQQMTARHTDLAQARNSVARAEQSVTLERRRPIPDLQAYVYFQQDTIVHSFQTGGQFAVEIPAYNRNQGNVIAATAQLARASREADRVRNDLSRQLADAFERYEAARQQIVLYRENILPDLARAFRGLYERYQLEPVNVNYNDLVTAQQNFVTQLNNYLQALQQMWQALADLVGTVQADDPNELVPEAEELGRG